MLFNAVSQELAHTSLEGVLPEDLWHTDIHFPLRNARITQDHGIPVDWIPKNKETCDTLHRLYHCDSTCPGCTKTLTECVCTGWYEQDPDTTFQPKALLKQRLENADRSPIDRMFSFGRSGSPFSGFPIQDDTGSFSALLHAVWPCQPLFTGACQHKGQSEGDNACTLLQALGEASDHIVQLDVVTKLKNIHCTRKSAPQSEPPSPVDYLTSWLVDFQEEYVLANMGVEVKETKKNTPGNNQSVKHAMICITGHESRSLREMMTSGEDNWSVKGDFFWVQMEVDSSNCFCEPTIHTDTHTYHLLAFISSDEMNGKYRWVATIRDPDDNFLVMDHNTCEPKVYYMEHSGLQNARLLLYGIKTPDPPAWLPQPSLSPGPGAHVRLLDLDTLGTDGLVPGSVRDLLTHMDCPNLQTELNQGVSDLVDKLVKTRQVQVHSACSSASTSNPVKGWPMPQKNELSLVSPVTLNPRKRRLSCKSIMPYGSVPVSGSVKSPMVDGIHPLVCSIFFVVVFSK